MIFENAAYTLLALGKMNVEFCSHRNIIKY